MDWIDGIPITYIGQPVLFANSTELRMTITFSFMYELKFGQWINVFIFFSVIVLYNIFSIFEIKLESIKANMPCIMIWQFPSSVRQVSARWSNMWNNHFLNHLFHHSISISEYWSCLMCLLHYDFCNLGNINRTIHCCYLSHSKSIPNSRGVLIEYFFWLFFYWVVWLGCTLFAMVLV